MCGDMYSNFAHINLGMQIYMCNIRMHVRM